MNRNTRLLSILMLLIMIFGLFGGSEAFAATNTYIKSDTPNQLNLPVNGQYTFKFTLVGSIKGTPAFSVGNSKTIEINSVSRSGNSYLVKIIPKGQQGDCTSIYSKISGQGVQKECTITLTESVYVFPKEIDDTFAEQSGNDSCAVKLWADQSMMQILWGENGYGETEVTVTNSNPDVAEIQRIINSGAESYSSDYQLEQETMGPSFTAQTTAAGKREELSEHIWSALGSLNGSNYFYISGKKAGQTTITATAISPTSGKKISSVCHITFLDPSQAIIRSDTPSSITLKHNQSYTFKLTASPMTVAQGISILTDVYYEDGFVGDLDTKISYRGNGVYFVTVSLKHPYDSAIQHADLYAIVNGRDYQSLCNIKIM